MKRYIPLLAVLIATGCALIADSFTGGGGSGSGTTVTVATPYITVGSTKYVAATLWPFTAFFSGSFLDANTCTLTAGTNGSENLSCNLNNARSYYSVAATTSVEAEFSSLTSTSSITNAGYGAGIWICDSTNSKLYAFQVLMEASTATSANFWLQVSSFTLASCNAGTPSVESTITQAPITNGNLVNHLKLVKSGGNLLAQVSQDGGQSYTQLASQAVGTLSKAGVMVNGFSGVGAATISATYLSVAVN